MSKKEEYPSEDASKRTNITHIVKEVKKSPYEYMESTGFGKTISGGRLHKRVGEAKKKKAKKIEKMKKEILK
jgi:hypothetical protein